MRKTILIMIAAIALSTSCRKAYTCTCVTQQPGIEDFKTVVTIDNTQSKAKTTCNSWSMTVAGTATTNCTIQ
ncbi:MAG TPA: hypothetical protein VNZ49_04325 [Bacteroidia bacterium]|jgi:hypothetical protein|nr:hypothetical protein [Bacteroidia bacterium]